METHVQIVYLGVPWNPYVWKGGEQKEDRQRVECSCHADPNNTSANLLGALAVKQPSHIVLGGTGFYTPRPSVLHGAIIEMGVSGVRWLSAAGGPQWLS